MTASNTDQLNKFVSPISRIDPISEDASIAEVLRWYSQYFRPANGWGRTKQTVLNNLIDELGASSSTSLSQGSIIQYATRRRSHGAGPATVSLDLSILASALRVARYFGCHTLSDEEFGDARHALGNLRVIGQSKQRARRPSASELSALMAYFEGRCHPRAMPVHTIIKFALATAMRLGEIVRIRWNDVDPSARTVLIRDRKHPFLKEGNHGVVPLLPDAWSLIENRSEIDGRIFPYNSHSVSRAFWEACRALAISDLRFHDLRHEAISRLFEKGLDIHQVAVVSGHKDWKSLKRYTHIKPSAVLEAYSRLDADQSSY